MGDLQHLVMNILRLAVTFAVPAVVWAMLAVGLYQLVSDKIRWVRVLSWRSRRLLREGRVRPV